MKLASHFWCLVAVVMLLGVAGASNGKEIPAATETDARLQADGKSWRLDKAQITDANRPRVLLIGDSILNGYGRHVIAALKGKAYVDLWVTPLCQSEWFNTVLKQVLEHGPYDVVHINLGLHGWQKGRIKDGTFEPLTKSFVEVIREASPGVRVIWASTTPVTVKGKPTELDGQINPVILDHNRMAAKVMTEMHVPINDFYGLLADKLTLARGDQFHWNGQAYELLAKAATASIERELKAKGGGASGGEPTNAKEAAQKKSAADADVDAKYAAWVATLSPQAQAWERTLQENLGSFYLPIHKREKVQGRSNAWDFVADDPKLPRVLLIGDSVSRGYTQAVRKALAGKANVHRAPENCGPSTNGVKKIDIWLAGGKWDVIHFNFGIHDRNAPPAEYTQRLEQLIARMKQTGAKLVWASTTPIPPDTRYGDPAKIASLNDAAAAVMAKHGVMVNDLFTFVTPHLPKVQNPGDVHFNSPGYDLLGQRVAEVIESALK